MIDSTNNPYGEVGSLIEGLTIADTHRILKSRPKGSIRFPKIHADVSQIVMKLDRITPNASTSVEEHNATIIEGLFVPEEKQTVEQKKVDEQLGETTLDLNLLKQKVQRRQQYSIRDSIAPAPATVDDNPDRFIGNVVAISKNDIKKSHKRTEKLSTDITDLMKGHLEMLMSFDNASDYVEAFAKDGLAITANEVSIDDSPFRFLSNFSAIEILNRFVSKSSLGKSQKEYYMNKVMDYYIKRSEIEADSDRKSEMLKRFSGQKTEGHVVDQEGDTHVPNNQFGAVVRRK